MTVQGLTMEGLPLHRLLIAVVAAMLFACGAPAARAVDFFAGKTLTMIVGFAPGGGVDTTARVVGQHGAVHSRCADAFGAEHGRRRGPRGDELSVPASRCHGLTIAMPGRSWYVEGALKGPGVAFDVEQLSFVGSPGSVNSALYVRPATGVHDLASLKASPKPLTFGTLGATTPTAMVPALLAADGYPVKVISGYVSTARILVALEQGEIDGFWTVEDSFARRHDLIDKNIVRPILQARPHLAGVPLLSAVIPRSQQPLLMLLEAPG